MNRGGGGRGGGLFRGRKAKSIGAGGEGYNEKKKKF